MKTPLPPARGIRWLSGSADSSNEGRRSVVETGAGAPFRPEVRPTYFAPSMRSPMFSSTSARPTPISIEAGYANQVPLERQGPIEMTTGRQIYGQPTYGLQSNIPSHMIVPLAQARGIYPMIRASAAPADAAQNLATYIRSATRQRDFYDEQGRLIANGTVRINQGSMGMSAAERDGKYGDRTKNKMRALGVASPPSLFSFDREAWYREGQSATPQPTGSTPTGSTPGATPGATPTGGATPGATPTGGEGGATQGGQQELLQPPEWARSTYSPAEWTRLGATQRQTLITQYFQSQRPDVVGQVVQGILQTGQFAVNAYLQYNREERDALLAAAQQQVQNRLNALERQGQAGAGDEATRAQMAQLAAAIAALGQARQSGDEQPSRLSPGVIAAIAVGGLVLVGGVIFLATRGGGGGGGGYGYGYGPPPRYRNNPRKRSRRRGH